MKPSCDLVRSLLAYDRATGSLIWKSTRGRRIAGAVAGKIELDGYRRIGFSRKLYPAHVLAWLIETGEWPASNIDHANGNRADNRWSNLRLASQSQNIANARLYATNTTGFKGVSKRQNGRYYSTIKVNGKSRCLGHFDTPEAAHAAYVIAAEKAFGEFSRAA